MRVNKVLLIDDDEVTNFLNKITLQSIDITNQVEVATNGEEALDLLTKKKERDYPELILLDINMPVMDGFEFLEQFRNLQLENKEKITIVVLSSSTRTADKEKIKNYNIQYLIKPLMGSELKEIVEKLKANV